jgi:hypothetical protein
MFLSLFSDHVFDRAFDRSGAKGASRPLMGFPRSDHRWWSAVFSLNWNYDIYNQLRNMKFMQVNFDQSPIEKHPGCGSRHRYFGRG